MKRDQYPTFLDWWLANQEEYQALIDAEDGYPEDLAALIEEHGRLMTREARAFIADRIRGKKKKRGSKRLASKQVEDAILLADIRGIQEEHDNCSEYRAIEIYLERLPPPAEDEEMLSKDTVISALNRAKKMLTEWLGRPPTSIG